MIIGFVSASAESLACLNLLLAFGDEGSSVAFRLPSVIRRHVRSAVVSQREWEETYSLLSPSWFTSSYHILLRMRRDMNLPR